NDSTLFAVGELTGDEVRWRPVTITCDCRFVTLGTWRGAENTIYAVGKGTGLYAFDPREAQVKPRLIHAFNAVGHLEIDQESGTAFATAAAGTAVSVRYDSFGRVSLRDTAGNAQTVSLKHVTGAPASGDDDIVLD